MRLLPGDLAQPRLTQTNPLVNLTVDTSCPRTTCQHPSQKGQVPVKPTAVASAPKNVNKRNLFVRLGLFFTEPEYNQIIIEQLLDDQLQRGLTTIDRLVADLDEYCTQFYRVPNNNCRAFMYGTFRVITWCFGHTDILMNSRNVQGRMDQLLRNHSSSLETLLRLICKPEYAAMAIFMDLFHDAFVAPSNTTPIKSRSALRNLDVVLNACTKLRIQHKQGVNFIDMVLGFGETPLLAATRARRADTIALLLKYGADSHSQWLSFEDCLEVLLFSPSMGSISDEQVEDIKRCLPLIIRGKKNINMKRLRELSKEYHPFIAQWEKLLDDFLQTSVPSPLTHQCRSTIRDILNDNYSLPNGVHDLPLPKPVKRYLDFTAS